MLLQNIDGYQVVNNTTPKSYLIHSVSYFILLQIALMVFKDEGVSHKSNLCGFYTIKQKI